MTVRFALALAVVTFALTGAGLIRHTARASGPSAAAKPPGRPTYLNPLAVALDPEGRRAYVALTGAGAVAEVDVKNGEVSRRIPCGKSPRAIAYHLGAVCVADDEPDILVIPTGRGQQRRVPLTQLPDEVRKVLQQVLPPWAQPAQHNVAAGAAPQTVPTLQGFHAPRMHTSSKELMQQGVFANFLVAAEEWLTGAPAIGFGGGGGAQFGGALGFAGGNNQTGLGFGGGVLGFGGTSGISGFSGGWGSSTGIQFVGINPFGRRASLDLHGMGSALPTCVVADPWSGAVFVSAAGSDCVVQLSASGLREFYRTQAATPGATAVSGGQFGLGGTPAPAKTPDPPNYFVQRLSTQAFPSAMALSADGNTLVVCNMLADSLTMIDCQPQPSMARHISLGGPAPDAARRGEVLFHSARSSKNGQFACASCHPGGGADGVPWHMPGGVDFARVPRPLHGVRDTAPYGWRGEDETLSVHVRPTLMHLFEYRPTEGELSDLVAYLESLPAPEQVPAPAEGRQAVERGRVVFEEKGKCQRCHQGETFQDGRRHDVGTGGEFDTPSLRGVGRRFPLLYDGRAANVAVIFQGQNAKQMHGEAHMLTKDELADLVAYLMSL